MCPEKCPLQWVNLHLYNFFICGPKFTRFLLSNVGGATVDQLLFGCSICRPVPEIFAIKVESCQKSEIEPKFGRLLPSQILGGRAFRKLYARYHPCFAPRRLEKFHEGIPTSPEVISYCNFGGYPFPVEMCDRARLGQSLARVKS